MIQKIVRNFSRVFLTKFYRYFEKSFEHSGESTQLECATIHKEINFEKTVGNWIGKGYVLTTSGLINTAGVTTANYKNRTQFLPIGAFLKSLVVHTNLRKQQVATSKKIFVPPQMWSSNFYHWLVEILPAIWYVHQHSDLKIAIPDLGQLTKGSFLRLLPNAESKRFVSPSKMQSFNTFLTISNIRIQRTGAVSLPNPILLQCYKSQRKKAQTQLDALLISRKFSGNRIIINEDSFVEHLRDQGFIVSILYPEKMDFPSQLCLLENAKIIIGPHGAGLTNIVFGIHTTMLIEVTGPNGINGSFATLSESLEVDYRLVCGENTKSNFSIVDKLAPARSNIYLSEKKADEICSIVREHINSLNVV